MLINKFHIFSLFILISAILASCSSSEEPTETVVADDIYNFSQQTRYLYTYSYESTNRIDTLSFIEEKDSLGKHVYLMQYSIPTYAPSLFCLSFEDNKILLHGRILEPFMKISCTDFAPDWHILADFSNQEWDESYTKNAKANIIHESKVVVIDVLRDIRVSANRLSSPPEELNDIEENDFHCIIDVVRTESIPDSSIYNFPNGLKTRTLSPISLQLSFREGWGIIFTKQDKYIRTLNFQ